MAAVYCSYGNLPILLLGGVMIIALLFQHRSDSGVSSRWVQAYWPPLAGLLTGAFAMLFFLAVVFDWQPVAGYLRGITYHQHWRPNLPGAWRHGLAFLEFGLFAGPPLMLAFLASSALATGTAVHVLVGYVRTKVIATIPYGTLGLTLATSLVMLTITLALGTPEAARLWLFMLPWVCCAASAVFVRVELEGAFSALLAGQTVLTFFVKNYLVW
jgi:hypothetical protein